MTPQGIAGKHIALCLCIFLFGILMSNKAFAQPEFSQKEFAKTVHRCFYEKVREAINYVESNYTEAYIAERLFHYFEQSNAELTSEAALTFCTDHMVPLYTKAHNSALKEIRREKNKEPDLAKLSQAIELHDKFA